jgi:hypothetical protein
MPRDASFTLVQIEVEKRRSVLIAKGRSAGQGISPLAYGGILDSYFRFLVVTETSFAALYRLEHWIL